MNKWLLILLIFFAKTGICQCLNTDSIWTNNITHVNARANWIPAPISDHYIIHYREIGAINWNNLANIGGGDTTRNIPNLTPSSTYEWQIKTFCDSSNQPNSGWSYSDTFTTIPFTAAPFNPIVSKSLGTYECNMPTGLNLEIKQVANEPDIETSTITSNKGYFNLGMISNGDSVGFAKLTTLNQNINSVLRAGIITGQNYAIINSYDSLGALIGFFSIENTNNGIKISSTSLNDGNNYTSGYVSEIYLANLFITPEYPGDLVFENYITSELNDVKITTDTFQIWCNTTNIIESNEEKEVVYIYDLLGRKINNKRGSIKIITFSDGSTEKRTIIKK